MKNGKGNTKKLIASLLYVLAAFAVYKVISVLTKNISISSYLLDAVKEIIFFAAALMAAGKLHQLNVLEWKKEGWGTGLLVGCFYLIMFVLTTAVGVLGMMKIESVHLISGLEVILFIVQMILVGVTEELLFRGLLQNAFHDYFGEDSPGAVRKAIVISALIFAVLHIFNIFSGAAVMSVIFQVIQVCASGMMFAAVYYRSGKNLWVGILLHTLLDTGSSIASGALMGVSTAESISGYGSNSIFMSLFILLLALFVTRNKKLQECIDRNKAN